jgi:hypothetical protein
MLSDLLILEAYYGHPSCAEFFEDLARRYGVETVRRALRAGEIITKPVIVGPDSGRLLVGLTDKGRRAVS